MNKMGLFNNPKKEVVVIVIGVAIFIAGLALAKCHAAELVKGPLDAPYIEFDAGETIIRGPTQLIGLSVTFPSHVLLNSFWQGQLLLIGSSKFDNQNAPNNLVLAGQFLDGFGRFDIGLGVAYMANYLPYNGQNLNFSPVLQYRFKNIPLTLRYEHFSDAGMTKTNIGRDMLMFGWRF